MRDKYIILRTKSLMGSKQVQQSPAAFRISQSQTTANFDMWNLTRVPTRVPCTPHSEAPVKLANIRACKCTKEMAILSYCLF